jgi:hypothetical protein
LCALSGGVRFYLGRAEGQVDKLLACVHGQDLACHEPTAWELALGVLHEAVAQVFEEHLAMMSKESIETETMGTKEGEERGSRGGDVDGHRDLPWSSFSLRRGEELCKCRVARMQRALQ